MGQSRRSKRLVKRWRKGFKDWTDVFGKTKPTVATMAQKATGLEWHKLMAPGISTLARDKGVQRISITPVDYAMSVHVKFETNGKEVVFTIDRKEFMDDDFDGINAKIIKAAAQIYTDEDRSNDKLQSTVDEVVNRIRSASGYWAGGK